MAPKLASSRCAMALRWHIVGTWHQPVFLGIVLILHDPTIVDQIIKSASERPFAQTGRTDELFFERRVCGSP
jgi:hypothetical protein